MIFDKYLNLALLSCIFFACSQKDGSSDDTVNSKKTEINAEIEDQNTSSDMNIESSCIIGNWRSKFSDTYQENLEENIVYESLNNGENSAKFSENTFEYSSISSSMYTYTNTNNEETRYSYNGSVYIDEGDWEINDGMLFITKKRIGDSYGTDEYHCYDDISNWEEEEIPNCSVPEDHNEAMNEAIERARNNLKVESYSDSLFKYGRTLYCSGNYLYFPRSKHPVYIGTSSTIEGSWKSKGKTYIMVNENWEIFETREWIMTFKSDRSWSSSEKKVNHYFFPNEEGVYIKRSSPRTDEETIIGTWTEVDNKITVSNETWEDTIDYFIDNGFLVTRRKDLLQKDL